LTREIFGCDFSELVEIDSLETTCECEININWDKPAEELLHELKCTDNDNDSESEVGNEGTFQDIIPGTIQPINCIKYCYLF
jgi:hypothetical protein